MSRTAGHCFYDVQSSARRSALGAGTIGSDRSSPRHKKELRNTLASARSEANFFRLTGNRVLKTAFVLRGGPLAPPPAPHPSAVRPFEPWRQQHQGSLQLRLRKFRIVVVSVAADRQSRQDRRCGWVGARFARRIPKSRLGRFSAFRGHTAPPSELPIAIGMDKTGIANAKQSLQFLDCLGNYAARPAGLELALQLNENLISAI